MRIICLAFLLSLAIFSCKAQHQSSGEQYHERCQTITTACEPNCLEKTFRACFIDSKLFPKGPYDIINNCHAVHVGNLRAPCQQLFSVNFGGSMRAVSCEEFFSALDRKNNDKACDGCLEQIGDSPFSYD